MTMALEGVIIQGECTSCNVDAIFPFAWLIGKKADLVKI